MSDIAQNPEEAEVLLLLGTMVRDAAHMEVTVEALTGHLIASNDPHAPGVQGEFLKPLIRKCREAAGQLARLDDAQRQSLESVLDRITAVAELRNAYVHGGWARDLDGSLIAMRGKRGQTELISHSVSAEQLREMIGTIGAINNELLEWLARDLGVAYDPIPEEAAE
ncbi:MULTISPECIES: hypothetical protein [unclassified Streptomyces]|uniref:hypothetical protein n=1 Tax=unclassified Streptomyces TaxID=2593676 RepID=UPI002E2A3740|nr:hypothetical protein [Streptomyces sp. NBC_00228]